MNILILGSGGRESAFAWKISQSPHCSQLFIAPGNGGTGASGKNVNLKITDFEAIRIFVLKNNIKMLLSWKFEQTESFPRISKKGIHLRKFLTRENS